MTPRWYSQEKTFLDRKSTRLNSSHSSISYAVFCLKKHKVQDTTARHLPLPNRSASEWGVLPALTLIRVLRSLYPFQGLEYFLRSFPFFFFKHPAPPRISPFPPPPPLPS